MVQTKDGSECRSLVLRASAAVAAKWMSGLDPDGVRWNQGQRGAAMLSARTWMTREKSTQRTYQHDGQRDGYRKNVAGETVTVLATRPTCQCKHASVTSVKDVSTKDKMPNAESECQAPVLSV